MRTTACTVMLVFILLSPGWSQDLPAGQAGRSDGKAALPEGDNGIARKYPGDRGIEDDPDVIQVEQFDSATLAEVFARWESVKSKEGMSLSRDVPKGSADAQSLLMTHVGGKGTGSHLYTRLRSTKGAKPSVLTGYDQVFARFYVKFDKDCFPLHHMGTSIGGYHPSTRWPQGGAGEAPRGNERFTTNLEPFGRRWRWGFYTYWKDMRGSPPRGQHWGNTFTWGVPQPKIVRGKWTCVEIMVKLNDPVSKANGEQAYWIDGKLWRHEGQTVSHTGKGFPRGRWVHDKFIPDPKGTPFEGYQWRTSDKLKINFIWTYLYITRAPAGHVSRLWFDNIVVARKYVGPLRPARATR